MAAASALKVVLRAAIAHATRASLLASAQATTLGCRRVSICRVQLTNGPEFLSSRCINALAHWTNNLRRFLSPLLLMPSKFVRPPVLYWQGTRPIDAAKSRLRAYCWPSPISAVSTLAVTGPTPGMVNKRRPRSSSASCCAISLSSSWSSPHFNRTSCFL